MEMVKLRPFEGNFSVIFEKFINRNKRYWGRGFPSPAVLWEPINQYVNAFLRKNFRNSGLVEFFLGPDFFPKKLAEISTDFRKFFSKIQVLLF